MSITSTLSRANERVHDRLGLAAIYTPLDSGKPSCHVKVWLRHEVDDRPDNDNNRITERAPLLFVRKAQVLAPKKGDRFKVVDGDHYQVANIEVQDDQETGLNVSVVR